ncbi:MAG: ABC transporter permease [Azoarcus sp.]|nr:ABC transporter permease [Azoarcus sp.]
MAAGSARAVERSYPASTEDVAAGFDDGGLAVGERIVGESILPQLAVTLSSKGFQARASWKRLHGRIRGLLPLVSQYAQYALFPLAVLLLWWYASAAAWLPSNILPSPGTVLASFYDLLQSGEISEHLGISLWRVVQGTALGVSLGLALGVALGASPAFESWIGPSFRILVQIPSIALIPLLMMVLGIDDTLKLFIMAKACVIPLALVSSDSIRNIPPAYLETARVMRLRGKTLYWRIILPGALPGIATGLRQGVAHVWISLVAVEMLASAEGIGYLMTWSRQIFQLDVVLVCVALIGITGFALDYGLHRFELRCLKWRGAE